MQQQNGSAILERQSTSLNHAVAPSGPFSSSAFFLNPTGRGGTEKLPGCRFWNLFLIIKSHYVLQSAVAMPCNTHGNKLKNLYQSLFFFSSGTITSKGNLEDGRLDL